MTAYGLTATTPVIDLAPQEPGVIKVIEYKSHRLACKKPFHFWFVMSRTDGKPVAPPLKNSAWTSLDVVCQEIDKDAKA